MRGGGLWGGVAGGREKKKVGKKGGGGGKKTNRAVCGGKSAPPLTGTQISTDGKVGTLNFTSPTELLLYFRSQNEPNVADGAPFTGTIHFTFSKSAAGN